MLDNESIDIQAPRDQAYKRGQTDFNFFAGLCLPHVMRFAFPDYYIGIWMLFVQALSTENPDDLKRVLRYVIGLPRGFCKTTFLKIVVVWLIVYDKLNFILIICATEPHSESFLADVDDILKSDNIAAIYGLWSPATDNSDTKKGSYHQRIVILKARSAGSAVRGINEGNMRPQLILCDDMQTKENADSETESGRLLTWFVGTLLKAADQFTSICFYIGNMYSKADQCILYKLKNNPHWVSLITGAILESGESLWPQLFTVDDLYDSFCHDESLGQADVWFAEVMNEPIESASSLIQGVIPVLQLDFIPSPDASFLTVDPAGFRKTSDDNVIAAHWVIDGEGLIAEMDGGIWNPKETVTNGLDMAVRNEASLIAVEEVGYQQSLLYWFNYFMEEEKITGINIVPLKRGTRMSKEQHIRAFLKECYQGTYAFMRAADRARFVWQGSTYRVGKSNNKDDWLDCPSMGVTVRNEYSHMLSVRQNLERQSAKVIGNNTPF